MAKQHAKRVSAKQVAIDVLRTAAEPLPYVLALPTDRR
jgi:hypothetical protein